MRVDSGKCMTKDNSHGGVNCESRFQVYKKADGGVVDVSIKRMSRTLVSLSDFAFIGCRSYVQKPQKDLWVVLGRLTRAFR
jgi:hypothetical protein